MLNYMDFGQSGRKLSDVYTRINPHCAWMAKAITFDVLLRECVLTCQFLKVTKNVVTCISFVQARDTECETVIKIIAYFFTCYITVFSGDEQTTPEDWREIV